MKAWEMIDVMSTNISQIGHRPEERLLRIKFESGTLADYFPVSVEEFNALKNAPSKGKHFNRHIKHQKMHVPVDMTEEVLTGGTQNPVSVRNPTEKSLRFDENKGRLEQTRERIGNHYNAVGQEIKKVLGEEFQHLKKSSA